MEATTAKSEILKDLKELKEKGVRVIVEDGFIDRTPVYGSGIGTLTINSGSLVGHGICHHNQENDSILKVKTYKKPEELFIYIFQNSTEEEIKAQITTIQNHINHIEKECKSSAIVDFLKEELTK